MKVAVAIIVDKEQRILITQRPAHVPHGGYWEFPGGKLEANETAEQALTREIKEEVGLEIQNPTLVGEIHHQYPDRNVHLIIFQVTQFQGLATCREGQPQLEWASKTSLQQKKFPEANQAILDLLSKM